MFIELTTEMGDICLINIDQVIGIVPKDKGNKLVYNSGDSQKVKESYKEIKEIIKKSGALLNG